MVLKSIRNWFRNLVTSKGNLFFVCTFLGLKNVLFLRGLKIKNILHAILELMGYLDDVIVHFILLLYDIYED